MGGAEAGIVKVEIAEGLDRHGDSRIISLSNARGLLVALGLSLARLGSICRQL